jgi:hypothetical protein
LALSKRRHVWRALTTTTVDNFVKKWAANAADAELARVCVDLMTNTAFKT